MIFLLDDVCGQIALFVNYGKKVDAQKLQFLCYYNESSFKNQI